MMKVALLFCFGRGAGWRLAFDFANGAVEIIYEGQKFLIVSVSRGIG
jgi:hypothetical protein